MTISGMLLRNPIISIIWDLPAYKCGLVKMHSNSLLMGKCVHVWTIRVNFAIWHWFTVNGSQKLKSNNMRMAYFVITQTMYPGNRVLHRSARSCEDQVRGRNLISFKSNSKDKKTKRPNEVVQPYSLIFWISFFGCIPLVAFMICAKIAVIFENRRSFWLPRKRRKKQETWILFRLSENLLLLRAWQNIMCTRIWNTDYMNENGLQSVVWDFWMVSSQGE